jgi:hypothetical protein
VAEPTTPRRFQLVADRVTRLEVKHEEGFKSMGGQLATVIEKMDEFLELGKRVAALETARAVQRAWVAGALAAGTSLGGFIGWALTLAFKVH